MIEVRHDTPAQDSKPEREAFPPIPRHKKG